jgi:dephospho-CoA kinase
MITIGLTGGLGTGKSTVAKMFARQGAVVIDADALVHESLKSGGSCYAKVLRSFGKEILEGKEISRSQLARIVFSSPAKLKKLAAIIHPVIEKEVQSKLKELKSNSKIRMVVIDAPLLIESGWYRWVDYLIVVRASTLQAVKRVQAKRNISRFEILRRMKAQMPITQKIRMADMVIDNRKNLNATQRQVEKIVQVLRNRM